VSKSRENSDGKYEAKRMGWKLKEAAFNKRLSEAERELAVKDQLYKQV